MSWKDNESAAPAVEKLLAFAVLVHTWNPKINLTGFKTLQEIEDLLIGESVQALDVLHLSTETVLDFGSGAGIPGLVWAICRPQLRIVSLEIREKKIAFQKEAQRLLGFRAEILRGHFPEDVADRRFDVIVSRAIRLQPELWAKTANLLALGGKVVRFMARGTVETGWASVDSSQRTTLLIR